MLRSPLTRLCVDSPELSPVERSTSKRRISNSTPSDQSTIRVHLGPSHPIKFAVVHAQHNVGRAKAAACCSHAQICAHVGSPLRSVEATGQVEALPDGSTPSLIYTNVLAVDGIAGRHEISGLSSNSCETVLSLPHLLPHLVAISVETPSSLGTGSEVSVLSAEAAAGTPLRISQMHSAPELTRHSHRLSFPNNRSRHKSITSEQLHRASGPNIDRYPPLHPPRPRLAPRRSSGSHRAVIFPHRRSSHNSTRVTSRGHRISSGSQVPPKPAGDPEEAAENEYLPQRQDDSASSSGIYASDAFLLQRDAELAYSGLHPEANGPSPLHSHHASRSIVANAQGHERPSVGNAVSGCDRIVSNMAALLLQDSPLDELQKITHRLALEADMLSKLESKDAQHKTRLSPDQGCHHQSPAITSSPLSDWSASESTITSHISQRSPLPPLHPSIPSHLQQIHHTPRPSLARVDSVHASVIHSTPKLPIYHDDRSPTAQPQTPADLSRDTHRGTIVSSMTAHVSNRRRARTMAAAGMDSENGIAGDVLALAGRELEDERAVWLARRAEDAGRDGGGGLAVTPPREGRFERFLS